MTGATIRRTSRSARWPSAWRAVAVPASRRAGRSKARSSTRRNSRSRGRRSRSRTIDKRREARDQDQQERGVHADRAAAGQLQGHRRKGWLTSTKQTHVPSTWLSSTSRCSPGRRRRRGCPRKMPPRQRRRSRGSRRSDGATLSNAGKDDEAIAKFNEGRQDVPKCAECYVDIGASNQAKKDYDEPEAAFKKAIELKPDFGEAYNGLANVYNAQKKFDQAARRARRRWSWRRTAGAARRGCRQRRRRHVQPGRHPRGTRTSSRRRRRSSRRPSRPTRTWPKRTIWLGMALVNAGKLRRRGQPHFETYSEARADGTYAGNGEQFRIAQDVHQVSSALPWTRRLPPTSGDQRPGSPRRPRRAGRDPSHDSL